MIPEINNGLQNDFTIETQPNRTYSLVTGGVIDGLDAVKQAIYCILNTERYEYLIYSWNYGIELQDLYGKEVSYVCVELKRRITEALTQDDRIINVDNFEFEITKGKIHVTFVVHTIFGEVDEEMVVSI
jgi:phage baseplate assembly protein W